MNLLTRMRGGSAPSERMSLDQVAQMLNGYSLNSGYMQPLLQQTLAGDATERPSPTFEGLARDAYAANGVVFACMLVRQLVFSSIRFSFQRSIDGRPADLFGHPDLGILERPWVGGTTQDMLSRMIQDADLAGNSFWVRNGDELVRLRPDWVEIVGRRRMMNGGVVGYEKLGYLYSEGGVGNDPVPFLASEVAHFAPIPDPLGRFTGMSWLTPILREVQADQAMGKHQRKFFDNAATPNLIVKQTDPQASIEKIKRFSEMMRDQYSGTDNAWKTLHLSPGADATVVGADMKQIDFKNVRGAGETRIAAAAGVPPVIVGLSEGLAAATYSNYGQARRRLADGTAHPLWQNLSGCLERIVTPKGAGVRLWYDAQDVPFLREDEKDAADIQKTRAETINTLITAGYEPASVIKAVDANDLRLLVHTGMTSVQLLPPGAAVAAAAPEPSAPAVDPTKETQDDGQDAPAV